MCDATNLNVQLFNFPTCTVPNKWQKLCFKSISDWKQKYGGIEGFKKGLRITIDWYTDPNNL